MNLNLVFQGRLSKPAKLVACMLSLSPLCSWSVVPVNLPGAGLLGNTVPSGAKALPQTPPAPELTLPGGDRVPLSAQRGETVVLRQVSIEGAQSVDGLSLTPLQRIAAQHLNIPQTFADLQALAHALTQECRAQGFVLAQVILPPQRINQGILIVKIYPGLFDTPKINNAGALSSDMVQRIVAENAPVGAQVHRAQLERVALLLADIPGMPPAAIVMHPGQVIGSTAMDITLRPGKTLGGYVGLDNAGVDSTGRSRVMAGVYANALLGRGDQLKIDFLDSYEKRNLTNGSVDYSLLVGGRGTRVGGSYSRLDYRYYLQGLKFDGYSDNLGLYVTHPWVRTLSTRIDVRADIGSQWMNDRYPSQFTFLTGDDTAKKQVKLGSLSLHGSKFWPSGGVSTFNLQGTLGNLDVKNQAAQFWSSSDVLGSAGGFARLNYQASHEQPLIGPFSLYGNINGQFASKNLDSSQKLLTGGVSAVRAYATGSGGVDDGVVASVELRNQWVLPELPVLGAGHALTLAGFFDQSWGQQYHHNDGLTARNQVRLAGAGSYVKLARNDDYALMLTWAHRTGAKDVTSGLSDRNEFWVNAVKSF